MKDPNAVLEDHFDAIIKDLLKSILGKRMARSRGQLRCHLGPDIGTTLPEVRSLLQGRLDRRSTGALDDVKATVRNAALHLCIALSNTLVRQLEEVWIHVLRCCYDGPKRCRS